MGIQEYLNDLVENQLNEIKYRFRLKISEDIKNRMCSLIIRWNNETDRKIILFPTKEEALYYEPFAENEIREFVVATIRNSMLEIAASDNCNLFKMQEPLTNNKIRTITSNAINYFKKCDMDILKKEVQEMEYEDVYENARIKYPLAWKVLGYAASMDKRQREYKYDEVIIEEIDKENSNNKCNVITKTAICDGYTLEFDEVLKEVLDNVISGE